MKSLVGLLLLWGVVSTSCAQQQIGFSRSEEPSSEIKLEGLTVSPMAGGYVALSVPAKDVSRFLLIVSKLEPHIALLELLDHLDRESKLIMPTERGLVAPVGICLLATSETFQHRHKALDRIVQRVGTYTYANAGRLVTVPVYASGPTAR